ncbi:DNA protecting protein DprA [Gammaproteobacteria bacterium 42_54_T18]|nr:DNA protecting protein DprA [Gammaproteobacteria bacterium 42_54_T18]
MHIMEDHVPYWLALWRVPRIGPVSFHKLLTHCEGDLPSLFALPSADLEKVGLKSAQIEKIKSFQRGMLSKSSPTSINRHVDEDLRWWHDSDNHHIVLCPESSYPSLLKEVAGAPPLLFVKGDVDTLAFPQIAIVGSRNPTRTGLDTAYNFSQHFARQGFITTSGLAKGIDGAAHQGALAAEGYTVAVLAHGLDQVYPRANQVLADKVVENGALVSEYPIGTGPRAEYFPRRNRIVSGMSMGVLVVEAAKKSGSLITAGEAVQQGREVFAIPGSIHNPLAKGCHELIRQGAKLVESGEHVVEELLPLLSTYQLGAVEVENGDCRELSSASKHGNYSEKSTEAQILSLLEHDPCNVDFVVSETGISVAEVNSALVMLELDGVIIGGNGGYLLA